MERKLASLQIIDNIKPILNADAIECAIIKGWKIVVKKDEFKIGSMVIYCEIDSFLPIRESFEFLRLSSYRLMGEREGFKLRTMKFRGQVSQGLILPITMLPVASEAMYVGTDVSELLGIVKYEDILPKELLGSAKAYFPSFCPKTTEERIQNIASDFEELCSKTYYSTEKIDGYSCTYYLNNDEFGVCSKDVDLLETPTDFYWQAARKLDIENKLRALGGNWSIQGELIGPGIRKNKYNLKEKTVVFFKVFNIDKYEYLSLSEFIIFSANLKLQMVPTIEIDFHLPIYNSEIDVDSILEKAQGYTMLNSIREREGIVITSMDMKISFKAISNKFLLKEGE